MSVLKRWNGTDWEAIGPTITYDHNDLVMVQDTQPTSIDNRIWVKPDDNDIEIPTMNDFNILKNPIDYFNKDLTIQFIDGGYIKTDISTGIDINTPVMNTGYRYAIAECEYGDWCEIHTNGAGAARAFVFIDTNGDKITGAGANANIDRVYIAPPNSKYLIINDKIADTDYSGHINFGLKKQRNINNIIRNVENKILNQIPINSLDLQFEYGGYTIYANDTSYYFDYPSESLTRIRSSPQAFIFLSKGTQIKTNNAVLFFNIIKKLDGTFTSTQWNNDYIVPESAYHLFVMKYADDSEIHDIESVASTLEITAPNDYYSVIRENLSFNRKIGSRTEKRIEFDFKENHTYKILLKFNKYISPTNDSTTAKFSTSTILSRSERSYKDLLEIQVAPTVGDIYTRIFTPSVVDSSTKVASMLAVVIYSAVDADYDIDIEILCGDKNEALDYLNKKDNLSEHRANDIVRQMKYRYDSDATVTPLSLLWFTDLHNDWHALNDIMAFKSKYTSYIDDVINTGDLYEINDNSGWHSINYYDRLSGTECILNVVGNHEQNGTNYSTNTAQYVYNSIIQNYVSYWDVVQPSRAAESGKNYYYKDYELPAKVSTNNKKIRLIVLDCIYGEANGQVDWLENVLYNARINNYSVICANHYKPGTVYSFSTPFSSLLDFVTNVVNPTYSSASEKVKAFIDNGGEFICWLTGHTHHDTVGTLAYDPRQICITLAAAFGPFGRGTTGLDTDRTTHENWNTWNMISFNPYTKTISVARFGAQYDMFLHHKDTMTINYETRTLV